MQPSTIQSSNRLRDRLKTEMRLSIPGFESDNSTHPTLQYVFTARDCSSWFNDYQDYLLNRIGNGYYPVFRFSDGECYFCLGYRIPPPQPGVFPPYHYVKTWLSAYFKYRCYSTFWSGTPDSGFEKYSGKDWYSLRDKFASSLRKIAEKGSIAACFCRHDTPSMIDCYIPNVYDWFDTNDVVLSGKNYVPFYFIYGMLLGPNKRKFLDGRSILVITCLDEKKANGIRDYLELHGAKSVDFIGISRSASMVEKIKLKPEHSKTDLVLIGAGVGAANILLQVEPLNAISIDAGFVLDCYSDPVFIGRRVYSKPDGDIFELAKKC